MITKKEYEEHNNKKIFIITNIGDKFVEKIYVSVVKRSDLPKWLEDEIKYKDSKGQYAITVTKTYEEVTREIFVTDKEVKTFDDAYQFVEQA